MKLSEFKHRCILWLSDISFRKVRNLWVDCLYAVIWTCAIWLVAIFYSVICLLLFIFFGSKKKKEAD